jgi:tetratricopeptide (TPR) repeat protein
MLLTVALRLAAQAAPSPAQGFALLDAGKPDAARQVFESILGSNSSDSEAQQGEVKASETLALQERGAGHMVEALRALMRAREFAPRNAHLLSDLGILEEEMKLYPDAEKALALSQQIDPSNLDNYYAMARVKMDEGQLDVAEQNMHVYLQSRPDDAGAHYGLGRIYELGMQFDKAKPEFQRSLELRPAQTESWYELGDMALKQNNYAVALTDFQKVLARDGRHGGALAGSGQALFREKRYSEALDLGLTLGRLGQKEESDRELLTAQKLADEENRNAGRRYQLSPAPPAQ